MSTRRERAKAQRTSIKVYEIKADSKMAKSRKEKFSNYLIDISKYVMTGVVIASLFKDLANTDNKATLYVTGLFIAFMSLSVGIVLTDKKKD